MSSAAEKRTAVRQNIVFALADLEGGKGDAPPFQISKIKKSNKTKQKIEDNHLEMEKERCLVFMCARVDTCINKPFSSKIFLINPLPFEKFLDPRLFSPEMT